MADPAGSTLRTVAAVLAAPAGGPAEAALLAPLAGRPVIEHSVAAFEASPLIDEILVVTPPALATRTRRLLAAAGYRKVSRVIEGGPTRIESAWEAIRILGAADCNLLLHDAARPLIGPRVIEDCVAALRTYPAVCAAVPASDTMVKVDKDLITERPPRDRLRRRQTPQGFRLEVIRRGYELALADPGLAPADDCGIVLRYLPEIPVRLVPGSDRSVTVTGPADIEIAEALLPAETTVTVMSFNIHHGEGTDGVVDLERTARVIRASGADIAGLQEVDRNFAERSDWTDQAAELAGLLNWHVAYGANIDLDPPAPSRPRIQFGNAVLSRYPMARRENTLLFRSPGEEQRGLLHVEVDVPGLPLHVYVTHLDAFSETDRVQQARQVAELVGEHCPAVLLGDFNARPEAPEIGTLRATLTDTWTAAAGGGGPLATHPADAPAARIDYIFTSQRLRAVWTSVSTDDPAASDHMPVVSRLVP